MMTISDKEANVGFSLKEFEILSILTSERKAELTSRLETCDRHKYIEISQLNAKLESIVAMINKEKEVRNRKIKMDSDTEEELNKLCGQVASKSNIE